MASAYEIPNLQFSGNAGGTIAIKRFVKIEADGDAVQAGAGEPVVGVSYNASVSGEVAEIKDGIVMVTAGSALAAGIRVQSDADGKAVALTTGSLAGITMTVAGAEDEYVSVKMPGGSGGSATAAAVVDATAGASQGTQASLVTGVVGSNTAIEYKAIDFGTAGNSISVEMLDPGTASAALSVDVTDSKVTVNLATDAGTQSSGTSGVEGNNNGITYTAVTAGTAGDDITIILEDPDANSAAASISVTDSTILIKLATDGAGDISSTATEVIALIAGEAAAAALVTGANTGASTGAAAVTDQVVELASGADPAVSSTASLVIAAVNVDAEASVLVNASNRLTSTGAGTVSAVAETSLANGEQSEGQVALAKINELMASLRTAGLLTT